MTVRSPSSPFLYKERSLPLNRSLNAEPTMTVQEAWQDFGIHPIEMLKRLSVERPPAGGSPLHDTRPAHPLVMTNLRAQLTEAIQGLDSLDGFQTTLADLGKDYGLDVRFGPGAPIVNWVGDGVLQVRHAGGPSAFHEMVHVVQCLIGGAAALGTLAAEKFRQQQGREPASLQELQPLLQGLTAAERSQAFREMVRPMEAQAYSRFEETAFHTAGMMGRKSRDREFYRERLGQVAGAFCDAYAQAAAPRLETGLDARIYGGIGHVARTHGETALVLGAVGYGYYRAARAAVALSPVLAIPAMAPLGYLLYRSLISG